MIQQGINKYLGLFMSIRSPAMNVLKRDYLLLTQTLNLLGLVDSSFRPLQFRSPERHGFTHQNGRPVAGFVINEGTQKVTANEAAGTDKHR